MVEYSTLWIAIIASGSAIIGGTIPAIINVFLRKMDYREKRFMDFIEKRVNANKDIYHTIFKITYQLPDFITHGKFITWDKKIDEFINQINESIAKNSFWVDIHVILYAEKFRNHLNDFIRKTYKGISQEDINVFHKTTKEMIVKLYEIVLKYSGIEYMNKKLSKEIKLKSVAYHINLPKKQVSE